MSRRVRLVAALVAAVALVWSAPAVPALWVGVTHLRTIGDGAAAMSNGFVRVESCARGALYFDWRCRGTFEVNDPMAEPYPPVPDVVLANDARRYRRGAQVQSQRRLHTHVAYLWGYGEQVRTVLAWIGIALCLLVLLSYPMKALRGAVWTVLLMISSIAGAVLVVALAAAPW